MSPRYSFVLFTGTLAAVAIAGCSGGETTGEQLVDGVFTQAEWEKVQALSPLPDLEPDTTNEYADNADAALLGQKLFFDPGYSGPIKAGTTQENGGLGMVGEAGKVSCESCHIRNDWLIDTRSNPNNTSIAIDWFIRNAPTLVNVATYQKNFGWVGYNDNLWGKNLIPAEFVMGTDRSSIVHYIYSKYKDEYNAIFTKYPLPDALDPAHADAAKYPMPATPLDAMGAWMTMDPTAKDDINRAFANFGKAIQAYERKLISKNAPFDKYVAGDTSALNESQKRGLKLFIGKAACVECHSGPTFSDEKFHVTGVPQVGDHVAKPTDDGRFGAIPIYLSWDFNTAGPYNDDPTVNRTEGVMQTDATKGAFRTKGLRVVEKTAPYMHTGHLATLEDVIDFYDKGGADADFAGTKDPLMVPLNLSSEEKADLVAFLKSLTGDPIPAALLQPPQ